MRRWRAVTVSDSRLSLAAKEAIEDTKRPLIVSRVLCDLNVPGSTAIDGEITLSNLSQLRIDPSSLPTNLRLELNSNLVHELNSLNEGTVVVDLTSDASRDIRNLHILSQQLKSVHLIACTGPFVLPNFSDLPILEVVHHLRYELLNGIALPQSLTPSIVQIGALSLTISSQHNLSPTEIKALECVARVQLSFLDSPHLPPPLFIELPHWSGNHHLVLDTLLSISNTFDLSRVILCHTVLCADQVDYFRTLLGRYKDFTLCIDSFGAVETPLSGPMYPNDHEIVSCIESLDNSRLLLSPHCRYKIHLVSYGGFGFRHLQFFLTQRLSLCASSLDISLMMKSSVVSWYSPPEIVVQGPEMIACSLCQKMVPITEQYEKFNKSYCSSRCLNEHRKRNWV